jgi:hypothetical protein
VNEGYNMYTLDSVWPQPPAGYAYVEQTLRTGDYLSTGYYPEEIAQKHGPCVAIRASTCPRW